VMQLELNPKARKAFETWNVICEKTGACFEAWPPVEALMALTEEKLEAEYQKALRMPNYFRLHDDEEQEASRAAKASRLRFRRRMQRKYPGFKIHPVDQEAT